MEWTAEDQRLFDEYRRAALANAHRIVARLPRITVELDEVNAAALRGLWRAIKTWKPQTKFSSWLGVCVSSVVLDLVRDATGRRTQTVGGKRKLVQHGRSVRTVCSIDTIMGADDQKADRFHPSIPPDSHVDLADWLKQSLRSLDAITQRVALLVWQDGYSYREAGDMVGLCQSSICLKLAKARKLLTRKMRVQE